jgi:hypothetical protein
MQAVLAVDLSFGTVPKGFSHHETRIEGATVRLGIRAKPPG